MNDLSGKKLELTKKVQKDFPEFARVMDVLPLKDLEKNLLLYAKHREETEMAKKMDKELADAKEHVKLLNGPYVDTIKALKLKTAYLNLLIQDAKEVDEEQEKQTTV